MLKCKTLIETNILGNTNTETKGVTNTQIQRASEIGKRKKNKGKNNKKAKGGREWRGMHRGRTQRKSKGRGYRSGTSP